jgi:hypothetical protein
VYLCQHQGHLAQGSSHSCCAQRMSGGTAAPSGQH